jgi:RNA polymerase sigma factor (TIGR02999 family)
MSMLIAAAFVSDVVIFIVVLLRRVHGYLPKARIDGRPRQKSFVRRLKTSRVRIFPAALRRFVAARTADLFRFYLQKRLPRLGATARMPAATPTEQATRLLVEWTNGDHEAAAGLMPLVYDELRRLARGYLQRERADHTLQATGLVHEAFIRLVDQSTTTWQNRAHFFGAAAQLMRRILVDHARRHRAGKRGGMWEKVEFDEALAPSASRNLDVIALDDALKDLAKLNPRHSQIVELRFFGGLTLEEAAEVLDVSPRTVEREWRMARAWLRRQIFSEESHDAGS